MFEPIHSPQRQHWLDTSWFIGTVYAASIAWLVHGLWQSPYPYTNWRFVVDYFGTELRVLALLLVATVLKLPPSQMGLCRPRLDNGWQLLPLALLMLATLGAWAWVRGPLPTGEATLQPTWIILRSTLLVGMNEEWMYRGILLVFLARRWGLRRGAIASLAWFGALHMINRVAGEPWPNVLMQLVMTCVLGAVFLMAALGSRSLWLPMLGHAIYDGALVDIQRMAAVGADARLVIWLSLVALLLGLVCLWRVAKIKNSEWAYAEGAPRGV